MMYFTSPDVRAWVFLLATLLFTVHATSQPKPMSSPVVYEIFVQSFCDSNGDGIGDLPGVISRLDYIRELGATAIWLTPVHPSPSYHKYDITDYYAIHPQFGTMADMDRLIREVHDRGMQLIMDLVINHTSSEHPWFAASASGPTDPYRPYYVWRDEERVRENIEKKTTTFDSDNLTQWHAWPGDSQRYYGFFWNGMPDLNFDHRPVREEVFAIARFWLDKGVDGFRLDAAKHIYPDDELDKTRLFWEEFRREVEAHHPGVLLFGEVWADPETLAGLFPGMKSLFNFTLARAIQEAVRDENPNLLSKTYTRIQAAYASDLSPLDDAILLSNHDMVRVRSVLGKDVEKSKLAASILLTLPGTVFLYYGEEIGLLGNKPDEHLREPFLWDENTYAQPHWLPHAESVPEEVTPLSLQQTDPQSLYHHYRNWMATRRQLDLGDARLELISDLPAGIWGYTLTTRENTYWVLHNFRHEQEQVALSDSVSILVRGRSSAITQKQ